MSSSEWATYKLGELGKLARGKSRHRPRDASFLYGGPYPFIQTGDIKSANHKIHKYSQTYNEKGLAQSKLWPKGTIAITIAANIADTAILTFPACFPDSVLGFVANVELCDIEFVEYLLQHYKKQIQSHAVGSVQDNINLGTFENVEFDIPPLATQKRIAGILSALDEKIELNRQMNATLEAIAQAIFREWFVRFNYPGATGELVESELGLIPAGWRVGTLGEILSFRNGKSSPERNDHYEYPVYGANGVIGFSEVSNSSEKDMIIGRVGSFCGAVYYARQKSFVTENAIIAEPKQKNTSAFCFFLLKDLSLNNYKTGSGQPLVNQSILSGINIVIPDIRLISMYEKTISFALTKMFENDQQSATLAQIRDALLPKLMRGEVAV